MHGTEDHRRATALTDELEAVLVRYTVPQGITALSYQLMRLLVAGGGTRSEVMRRFDQVQSLMRGFIDKAFR